ncbi:hypothetical protein J2Z30_006685 [Streptomyces iranensis]|uniref:Uncharacterized protein n=1 Tax=Streptomyces iranensis TaxID=576784 RepID=A0ABS4N0W5_9ACTN|nr:hypothetical protein [Streptomyces iranensis]
MTHRARPVTTGIRRRRAASPVGGNPNEPFPGSGGGAAGKARPRRRPGVRTGGVKGDYSGAAPASGRKGGSRCEAMICAAARFPLYTGGVILRQFPGGHDDRAFSENCRCARAVGAAMHDKRYGKRQVKSVLWPTSWPGTERLPLFRGPYRRRERIRVGGLVPRPVPSGASRKARRCRKRRGAGSEERATVDEECRHRIRARGGERPKKRRSSRRLRAVSLPCRRRGPRPLPAGSRP